MSWQDASTATHKIVRAYVKRLRNRLDDDDAAQAPLGAGRAHAAAMPARRLSDARPSGAATAEHPADQNDRCSRSACVVNGRLRHTGKDPVQHAPPCVVSRVGFYVLQTSMARASAVCRRARSSLMLRLGNGRTVIPAEAGSRIPKYPRRIRIQPARSGIRCA